MKKKYSKKFLDEVAAKKNGVCLSQEYKGMNVEYLWECSEKHKWEATLGNVLYNKTWCRECHIEKRYSYDYEKLKEIALKKKLVLLTKEFIGIEASYQWKCKKKGHLFEETLRKVNIVGCEKCKRKKKLTILDVKRRIKKVGFELLEEEFRGVSENHLWKCVKCNTIKKDSYKTLFYGKKGCSECKRIKMVERKRKEVEKLAKLKGYEVVNFVDGCEDFSCVLKCFENGHLRDGNIRMLRTKSGCGECASEKNKKYGFNDAVVIAKKKKGRTLSKEFNSVMIWECEKNHVWEANFYNVKNGTWCPDCAKKNGKRGRPSKKR